MTSLMTFSIIPSHLPQNVSSPNNMVRDYRRDGGYGKHDDKKIQNHPSLELSITSRDHRKSPSTAYGKLSDPKSVIREYAFRQIKSDGSRSQIATLQPYGL
ncbi:hypothetical protein IVB11_26750 [Bradyrhizobium sp. 177]|uniref:hypothetical protein n=1 Tax=Bradyrhizobium sp. 177 TaxID=2782647 RepID=UPI001FF91A0A|nr:hypothetical protein [Bradyrhizobium sp. 177]MCK1552565.1 hypothetical protein [Bradyrhizobium sp. 177]